MPDSPTDQDLTSAHHTRREFIKNVLLKTAYAVPVVATFAVAEDSEGMLHGNNNPKKGPRSNNSNRKISKVSGPSRPSSGSGIKYSKKNGSSKKNG